MTSPVELSVLVPSYRRPAMLRRCLDHLAAQQGAPGFEVVVMIDGEDDYAAADLERRAREFPVPLTWRQLPHRGHSVVMNEALRLARADRVLVIGDDILAAPDLVARHVETLRALDDPRVAVQGKVVWHPEVLPDPFLEWDAREGALFGFAAIPGHAFVPARFLYTCNVSFTRAFVLEAGGFNEAIPRWVDTEFAFRAARLGMRLYYEPDAWGWHHDRWTVEREAERQRLKGALAARLIAEHPDFAEFVTMPRLDAWRAFRYRASRWVRPLAERVGPRVVREWCWTHELHYRFARGLAEESARMRAGGGAKAADGPRGRADAATDGGASAARGAR